MLMNHLLFSVSDWLTARANRLAPVSITSRSFLTHLSSDAEINNSLFSHLHCLKSRIIAVVIIRTRNSHGCPSDPADLVGSARAFLRVTDVHPSRSRTDRDTCFRCRTAFSAFTRKHHCRACGETFCSTCMSFPSTTARASALLASLGSSKSSPLLEFGIEDEVRVCESCYDRLTT